MAIVLSDEIETSLRLMGVVDVSELDLSFVNTTALEKDLVSARNLDGRFKARHRL